MKTNTHFFIISRAVLLVTKLFETNKRCRDNQITHFVFSKFFFRKSLGL